MNDNGERSCKFTRSRVFRRNLAKSNHRRQQPIASSSKLPDDSQRGDLNVLDSDDENSDFLEPSEEELAEEREQLRQCEFVIIGICVAGSLMRIRIPAEKRIDDYLKLHYSIEASAWQQLMC